VTYALYQRIGGVQAILNSAPYSTHSFSQGQRQLQLKTGNPVKVGKYWSVQCTAPNSANVLPPAYYMFFVVQNGIPSRGVWVQQIN
jgi:hypothetical protein